MPLLRQKHIEHRHATGRVEVSRDLCEMTSLVDCQIATDLTALVGRPDLSVRKFQRARRHARELTARRAVRLLLLP
jgi:hypothetical protein